MEWLNYHHLLYFWMVARSGGVAPAAQRLRLAQPTVSAQVRQLERRLGIRLFEKAGRRLALTEAGRQTLRYADEIFTLGRELLDSLSGRPARGAVRLVVGVADALPKLIAHRLIAPALELPEAIQLVCVEASPNDLLARLSLNELDVVLSDAPIDPHIRVRAFNHLLGECGVSFFAPPELARRLPRRFPACLDGAPLLLPTRDAVLRRDVERWFESVGVRPRICGEFQDSALLKVFGQTGLGVFAAPRVIEGDVRRAHGCRVLGRTDAVREQFYAISIERKLRHPAVVAITNAARQSLFRARGKA